MSTKFQSMPLNTDLHPETGSVDQGRNSISPLPLPTTNGSRFATSLPALQDSRFTTGSSYEHTSSPGSATSLYSPFSYHNSSYPTSASSYSPTIPSLVSPYSITSDSRSRIPSLHSPSSSTMPRSGVTKTSVSPRSSIRDSYATNTPHISRHLSRGSHDLASPHSPHAPTPRSLDSSSIVVSPSISTPIDGSASLNLNSAGPPLSETVHLLSITSQDGHPVRPEIHARVDKGFFLADRDWTCYRRNYFAVVASYSLNPATHALPLYVKRPQNAQPEHVLAFAVCISAVVDAPTGKQVELVQHTPKRDKGPQMKPQRVTLAPQPANTVGLASAGPSQANHTSQHSVDQEFGFTQQSQQNTNVVATFERIQFKSATANNGKRRAAQQYYHLMVELYARFQDSTSVIRAQGRAIQPGDDDCDWVKIAYRCSAPMVVRGRSPGHYADERRVQSPGGGGAAGNGGNRRQSPTSGGSGMMSNGTLDNSSTMIGHGNNGLNMNNLTALHNVTGIPSNHTSPSASSVHNIQTPPPLAHLEPPIDPVITGGDDGSQLEGDYSGFQYFPSPLYDQGAHPTQIHNIYEHHYGTERKSEAPLMPHYESDLSAYIPTSLGTGDPLRKTVKEENHLTGVAWGQQSDIYRRCGRFEPTDSSRGYYPDLPAINSV